jgi:hypothetical protein
VNPAIAMTTTINSGIHPRLRTFILESLSPLSLSDHFRVANTGATSAQSVSCTVNYLCPRWRAVQREASAEMIRWQHFVAICVSVVTMDSSTRQIEERAHDA